MTLFSIFIGISVAVIGLVVYSTLIVSGKQDQLARRIREENRFQRAPYSEGTSDSSTPVTNFAFEASEDLIDGDVFDVIHELSEFEDYYF